MSIPELWSLTISRAISSGGNTPSICPVLIAATGISPFGGRRVLNEDGAPCCPNRQYSPRAIGASPGQDDRNRPLSHAFSKRNKNWSTERWPWPSCRGLTRKAPSSTLVSPAD